MIPADFQQGFFILTDMVWSVKYFRDLSLTELYDILKLRVDIFVLEQECPYEEVDGKDMIAIHIMGYEESELVAYCRVFAPGKYYLKEASIGRVAVAKQHRGRQLGIQVMHRAMEYLKSHCHNPPIKLAAQKYLERFYTNLGYQTVSDVYPWDGIDHVDMIRDNSAL